MVASEPELVRRLRAGDEAAFETLVREQGGRMLTVARRVLRNEHDARDAVQEAFVSAYRAIDRFEEGAKPSTWLHRITLNAALMKIRAAKRRPEESIDDLQPKFREDGHHVELPAPWEDRPDAVDERETFERHIADCPPCGDYLDSYRMTIGLCWESLAIPEDPIRAILEAKKR